MTKDRIFIQSCGLVTPLGKDLNENARALFAGFRHGIVRQDDTWVGSVTAELPQVPEHLRAFDCRNNRLLQAAMTQIADAVEQAKARYGKSRIAVIMGTSTSGMADGEKALAVRYQTGAWPADFHYRQQEVGNPGPFAAAFFGLSGPAYTISTACSSSAKVFASARRLIRADLADAVLIGGADTLCRMTMEGFRSLGLTSPDPCNPFSINRKGITIGEGAAVFLLSKDESAIEFLGAGETSDAHHLTAPAPDGSGAAAAMQQALEDAGLKAGDIAYINLHGTATPLNDAMEAHALSTVFGAHTPCGSTKGMTGHMLGATGGCEAAFLWLSLNPDFNPDGFLPPHAWDGHADPELPALSFVTPGTRLPALGRIAMLSNSFGFGGSNASLILSRS